MRESSLVGKKHEALREKRELEEEYALAEYRKRIEIKLNKQLLSVSAKDVDASGLLPGESSLEAAVMQGLQLLRSHRRGLHAGMEEAKNLIEEIQRENKAVKAVNAGRKLKTGQKEPKLTVAERAKLLTSATNSLKQLIPLERQTYDLDSVKDGLMKHLHQVRRDGRIRNDEEETVMAIGDTGGKDMQLIAFPSEPLSLADWETQMSLLNRNQKKIGVDGDGEDEVVKDERLQEVVDDHNGPVTMTTLTAAQRVNSGRYSVDELQRSKGRMGQARKGGGGGMPETRREKRERTGKW
ncbi:MAG: hypothetical protein JJV89_03850 [Desulfosarcina sp.]|nr:hypothetical protein [Desulfobacterales bacterium]